jgi:protein-S-isoprenylcysteine O-methyltransferase Ste14
LPGIVKLAKMTSKQPFPATKLYDVLAAAPLIFLYATGIVVRLVPDMEADARSLPSPGAWVHLARDATNILYFSLIIFLVFIRCMPVAKSEGLLPRAVALAGAYMAIGRGLLPFAHLPAVVDAVAAALTLLGTILSIIVLAHLGRAFSILPEARKLVTDGPYGIVRHPLYVAEEIGNIGVVAQYAEPWSLLIEIVSIAMQLWRISFEERVLTRAFPEYAAYAARTARLIPGVY